MWRASLNSKPPMRHDVMSCEEREDPDFVLGIDTMAKDLKIPLSGDRSDNEYAQIAEIPLRDRRESVFRPINGLKCVVELRRSDPLVFKDPSLISEKNWAEGSQMGGARGLSAPTESLVW